MLSYNHSQINASDIEPRTPGTAAYNRVPDDGSPSCCGSDGDVVDLVVMVVGLVVGLVVVVSTVTNEVSTGLMMVASPGLTMVQLMG